MNKNKDLSILIEIQQIDTQINNFKNIASKLPEELNISVETLKTASDSMEKIKKEMEEHNKICREAERDILASKDRLIKLNTNLNDVKTNKEYVAMLSEIDIIKSSITTIEDKELVSMDKLESLKLSLKEKTDAVNTKKNELEKKRAENKKDIDTIEAKKLEAKKLREEKMAGLDTRIYETYLKIYKLRGDKAVVELKNGVCGGCFKRIMPQMEVEVALGEKLITCPHCSRFLYTPNL